MTQRRGTGLHNLDAYLVMPVQRLVLLCFILFILFINVTFQGPKIFITVTSMLLYFLFFLLTSDQWLIFFY